MTQTGNQRRFNLTPRIVERIVPYILEGEDAPKILDEYNSLVDSKYSGNNKLKILELKVINNVPTLIGSSPLILPVVNELVAPQFRVAKPEEIERTLREGDPVHIEGNHYINYGIVLDFSRNNHYLAVKFYESLSSDLQDFERFPALLINYGLENSNVGGYGVIPTYQEGAELRTAKILARQTSYFSADDSGLVQYGLPKELSAGKRRLYTTSQREPSKDNLGLSGLSLDRDRDLNSLWSRLDGSGRVGRVVLVRTEAFNS